MDKKTGLCLIDYGCDSKYEVECAILEAGKKEFDRVRVVGSVEVIYKKPEFKELPDRSNWKSSRRLEGRVWSLERRLRNHVTTIDYMAHK